MFVQESEAVRLEVSEDGLTVVMYDRRRKCGWRITDRSVTVRDPQQPGDSTLRLLPLPPGTVRKGESTGIESEHRCHGGRLLYRWTLEKDAVVVVLECRDSEPGGSIAGATLPGRLRTDEPSCELLIPQYQGALVRRSGESWHHKAGAGGHTRMSMGMAGYLSSRSGLLLTPEDPFDWDLVYGEDEAGLYAFYDLHPGAVEGWFARRMVLLPCDPSVVSIAKSYRRYARKRGRWVSWEEKIAAKPMLEDLFGALIAFVGYIDDPETDYVAGVQALQDMGFGPVFLYPVRFAHYSRSFTMAGHKPIWLDDDTIARLKALPGVHPAPWAWTVEGIDDGSAAMHAVLRRGPNGALSGGWTMDHQRWQHVCTPYQIEHIKCRLEGDMQAMDWLHYDVNATLLPSPCFRRDHALHDNRPLATRSEAAFVRRLLSAQINGNRVVSSEGFNDAYTAEYDIGSTKMIPHFTESNPAAIPVPLTQLVYHDCCLHDWWEMHNYNANPCWNLNTAHTGVSRFGIATSGLPRLKAAQDALYGLPPNVFPFGRQYGWKNRAGGETYDFRMTLQDREVREALACALPVARLHRRIGKLELEGFEFLSDDRFLQVTTFSDGTRVAANLGSKASEAEELGRLDGCSWRVVE